MVTEKETNETAKSKSPMKIIGIVIVIAAIAIGAGAFWYVNYQIPHNEAVESFNSAASGLEERNAELDKAVSELQMLATSGDKPLDSSILDAASVAIGEAQGSKKVTPEMPTDTADISVAASEIKTLGNYDEELDALEIAWSNLDSSIQQFKQVVNPTEQFVIQRLTGLPNITGIEAVTENNDPNGNLGKAGGYTATVYFTSDLVDQSKVYLSGEHTVIVDAGCDGGGAIEVYANEEDAEKRLTYLSSFDGGILSSGSHTVVGTCLIRTSNNLTASQQQAMEQAIIEGLTLLG
ncbi:hypothetical protein [Gordonibacter sp.]|uniref:hypothetical protein n=1 Tax=Gordonibacter sp. TaxID=1968902 RepID=UPI002FC7F729